MKQTVTFIIAIILLASAVLTARYLIQNKNKPRPKVDKLVKTVLVDTVRNTDIPIVITASGNLVAKQKIELFSEVQGVLESSAKEFKAGTTYRKGELILQINSDEFYANLQAQKSSFFNSLTLIMPDIRLDYPEQFSKWERYVNGFDINKTTPKLPEFASDKERYFVAGNGITTAYFNVKNLEVKLAKHNINAPFNGIVTEALVNHGTLVRTGQKLGELIDPGVYELEVSVQAEYADLLKIGNEVTLKNLESTKSYNGRVARVNGRVDAASQTIKAYIEVASPVLREGMYLEAQLDAKKIPNAIEIPRKLLIDNQKVFVVNDTVLSLEPVKPVYFTAETTVVQGLVNGSTILAQPVAGAYDGMKVAIQRAD